jgi:hypothetical protein
MILIEQTSSNWAIDALPGPSKNPECTEPDYGMEIGQNTGNAMLIIREISLRVFYMDGSVNWFYSVGRGCEMELLSSTRPKIKIIRKVNTWVEDRGLTWSAKKPSRGRERVSHLERLGRPHNVNELNHILTFQWLSVNPDYSDLSFLLVGQLLMYNYSVLFWQCYT